MADLVITPGSVLKGTNATTASGIAGATITAGQTLYKDAADENTLKPADCDSTDPLAVVVGIALNGGSDGQTITYQTGGEITIGATVVVGEIYVQSGNAGFIAAEGDLATNDRLTIIGFGKTAAIIQMALNNTLIVVA